MSYLCPRLRFVLSAGDVYAAPQPLTGCTHGGGGGRPSSDIRRCSHSAKDRPTDEITSPPSVADERGPETENRRCHEKEVPRQKSSASSSFLKCCLRLSAAH